MLILLERVSEAQRIASKTLREMQANDPMNKKRGRGGGGAEDNGEEQEGDSSRAKNPMKSNKKKRGHK